MHLTSKKASLLILGITSLVCSRTMFWLFNDPEGPNLLIIVVAAVVIYLLSLAAYVFIPSVSSSKRLLLAISIQILVAAVAYFFLS